MILKPENACSVVNAACVLHNFLKSEETGLDSQYASACFADQETSDASIIPGEWRKVTEDDSGMRNILSIEIT